MFGLPAPVSQQLKDVGRFLLWVRPAPEPRLVTLIGLWAGKIGHSLCFTSTCNLKIKKVPCGIRYDLPIYTAWPLLESNNSRVLS